MSDGLLTPLSHESSSKAEHHATDTHSERLTTDGVNLPKKPTEAKLRIVFGLPQALQVIEDGLEMLREHSTENINRRIELMRGLMHEVAIQSDVAK